MLVVEVLVTVSCRRQLRALFSAAKVNAEKGSSKC